MLSRHDGDLGLEMLREGEIHRVDVVAGDHFTPIRNRFPPSPLTGEGFGLGEIATTNDSQLGHPLRLKEGLDLTPSIGMGAAHELGADQGDAEVSLHGCDFHGAAVLIRSTW
jgi:hypothetical protein